MKYLITIVSLLLFISCSNQEKDIFEDSAAQRLNKAVEEKTALLESSPHGWLVELYPSDGELGGYLYAMTFADGKVTMIADEDYTYDKKTYTAGTPYTSLYRVKSELECMLTFDTYTPYFHAWTEPLSSSQTTGYETDYEYCFKSVSQNQDTISLEGKKWGTRIKMVRLHQDGAPIIKATAQRRASFIRANSAVVDGDTIRIKLRDGQLTYAELGRDTTVSYAFTETGLHFRRPVRIGRHIVKDLIVDDSGVSHTQDGAVTFIPATPMEQFRELDRWLIAFYYYPESRYEQPIEGCSQLKTAYENALFSFYDGEGIFYYMYIGKDDLYPDLDLYPYCVGWYMHYGTDNYYLADNVDLKWNDDELTIKEIQAGWNYEVINQITGNKLGDIVTFFTANSPFKVTFDDPLRPKKAILTSKKYSDRWVAVPF